MLRFSGLEEDKYESWRMWAKAHLRTRQKKDDLGVITNEEELAAVKQVNSTPGLATFFLPSRPA